MSSCSCSIFLAHPSAIVLQLYNSIDSKVQISPKSDGISFRLMQFLRTRRFRFMKLSLLASQCPKSSSLSNNNFRFSNLSSSLNLYIGSFTAFLLSSSSSRFGNMTRVDISSQAKQNRPANADPGVSGHGSC